MRFVIHPEDGVVAVNYMWLPTWLGMNSIIKKELDRKLSDKVVGKPLTDELLEEVHELVIEVLCESHPNIEGLHDYLDGVKFVKFTSEKGEIGESNRPPASTD